MLQAIVSVFAGIAGLASFVGFVFLSRYYEVFGVDFQYFNLNPNHSLFRGIYLLYSDSFNVAVIIIFLLMISVTSGIQGFNLGWKVIGRTPLIIATAIACTSAMLLRAQAQASNFADRDMRVDSTALRQLTCVSENQVALLDFLRASHAEDRKVLILVRQNESILLFSAPENQIGRRKVELFETTISGETIVGHHDARYSILHPSQLLCTS